jgi:hypothetical protein
VCSICFNIVIIGWFVLFFPYPNFFPDQENDLKRINNSGKKIVKNYLLKQFHVVRMSKRGQEKDWQGEI